LVGPQKLSTASIGNIFMKRITG